MSVIREMQIKPQCGTTLLIRTSIISITTKQNKNSEDKCVSEDVEIGTLCWWEYKLMEMRWENNLVIL